MDLLLSCDACHRSDLVPAAELAGPARCGRCKRPYAWPDAPFKVDEDDLAALIARAPLPLLVEVFAPDCAPCRALAPTIAQLAARAQGRALVAKVDAREARGAVQRLGIKGYPTVVAFRKGREVAREQGAVSLDHLEDLLGLR